MIQEFPDILRPAPCVYQTQTVWDIGLDTIKVEKVSVMNDTLLGMVRCVMYYIMYGILVSVVYSYNS